MTPSTANTAMVSTTNARTAMRANYDRYAGQQAALTLS
jgi:hypothetical protein